MIHNEKKGRLKRSKEYRTGKRTSLFQSYIVRETMVKISFYPVMRKNPPIPKGGGGHHDVRRKGGGKKKGGESGPNKRHRLYFSRYIMSRGQRMRGAAPVC